MNHRNIHTSEWTAMAIDSLFTRGKLEDWREFAAALREDTQVRGRALRIAESHEDRGSAALLRILLARLPAATK